MPLKPFVRLYFIIVLPLLILGSVLLVINQPPVHAEDREFQLQTLSCNDPLYTSPITPADQYYGEAIPLLENQVTSTIALQSAYADVPNALEKSLDQFFILKEGDTYYLWIGNRLKTGLSSPINSLEQRFESKNGLVWCNRTNTNLTQTDTYKFLLGPHNIIKNGNLYEGWEEYYYEWSVGWGYAIRYITSTNGITWTVANQPALIGNVYANIIKEGNTYRMWANPHGDTSYQGSRSLRYRTSTNGGTGWGHWQTGGTLVSLDGGEVVGLSRVRRLADGTHQLFYLRNNAIHLATSTTGMTFTTQISNFVSITKVLPITDANSSLWDFAVVDVGGEDWVYLSYCKTMSAYIGRCINSYMGVARPNPPSSSIYLPTILLKWPTPSFQIFIGDAINTRAATPKGEIFYDQAVEIPDQLPSGGSFYFSSQPDTLEKVLVDDKIVLLLDGVEIYSHNFSRSGSPKAAILQIPRSVMEQMAGKTIKVQYRDVYGVVVRASPMWIIWMP